MSRPPKAHLTPNETFRLKLWIARAYLLLEDDSEELAYQLEWIRACTGMDEASFEEHRELGRWGAKQLYGCTFDRFDNAADALSDKIRELESELVSA